jgi:hypothetical protein
MNHAPYIPRRTRHELAAPAPEGHRHEQAKRIIISLIANGLSAEAVFAQVRGMYDLSVTDEEVIKLIRWATRQNFSGCRPLSAARRTALQPEATTKRVDPAANIEKYLDGFSATEADLWDAPGCWHPGENWRVDSLLFLAGMFHAGELVNIVTDYTVDPKGKANPDGYGLTLERDAMMRHIRSNGTPQSKAGAWVRINPLDGHGIADANVTAFRFALLEIDKVPVELQLSLLARLPLPVNVIQLSGGKSVHAIVRVNAKSAESYRAKVNEVLALLRPFGIDQANKNPSRLTRLPGAQRIIGATGDGQQRLLYLAPDRVDCKPIFEVTQ